MHKFKAALVAALVVALVVVAAPSAAEARTNPPAGAGYQWGYPLASLGSCITPDTLTTWASRPSVGGWGDNRTQTSTWKVGTTTTPGMMALNRTMLEPCYGSTGTAGTAARIVLQTMQTRLAYPASPPYYDGSTNCIGDCSGLGAPLSDKTTTWVECQTTEWATTSTKVYLTTNGLIGGTANGSGTTSFGFGPQTQQVTNSQLPSFWNAIACAYVRTINVRGCVYLVGNVWQCEDFTWSAERSFRGTPYVDEPTDPGAFICDLVSDHPDCPYILPPGGINGTDPDSVCGAIPAFSAPGWDVFSSWIPTLVNYSQYWIRLYARCMWYPVNGFDRSGWVADAWASSSASAITVTVGSVVDGWQFSPDCGYLFESGPDDPLPGFGINTCDWSSSAAPAKTLISWVMTIWFAWWAIQFLIACILGVVNRKIPSPISSSDSSALGVHFE